MSASQKKKLRNEQNAAQLTEKQLEAAKEAKKLRLLTMGFAVLIGLMVCFAIVAVVVNSGVIERNTTAVTVDGTKITVPELNHYYIDTISNYTEQYGDYLYLIGIDTSEPLDEQYIDEEAGTTWADYFLEQATATIQNVYAVYNAAVAAGYTVTEEDVDSANSTISMFGLYGSYSGFSSVDAYIAARYGEGCDAETYRNYATVQYVAKRFAQDYYDSLVYTDEDLRSAESENPKGYNAYSYNYYTMSTSKFLEGGTTDAEGNVTFSDEEKAAAIAACEEAAKSLTDDSITSTVLLDKAIGQLSINAETTAASTVCVDYMYSNVTSTIRDWVTSDDRQPGDMTYIPSTTSTTDAEGNTTETITSYTVVFFNGSTDNTFTMSNVRHILVAFEGGTTDSDGNTVYSDEEKAAAKTAAEELLATFLAGDATEDAFATLANENTDDSGSNTNGGLYENIVPSSNYVEAFKNWAVDDSRKTGDTEVIETEYGYHVMYYVGDSEETYRDYMIESDLRSDDMDEWETGLTEAAVMEVKDTSHVMTNIVLES